MGSALIGLVISGFHLRLAVSPEEPARPWETSGRDDASLRGRVDGSNAGRSVA